MGFYSKKYKTLEQLPEGASVAIPNDPTNGGRALLLLQSKGFLKLKDGVGLKPTIIDITENKKKLQIRELDAAQLPRSLGDVDAAAINTNYAIEAGLDPVVARAFGDLTDVLAGGPATMWAFWQEPDHTLSLNYDFITSLARFTELYAALAKEVLALPDKSVMGR